MLEIDSLRKLVIRKLKKNEYRFSAIVTNVSEIDIINR